jgi:hypothetical protein
LHSPPFGISPFGKLVSAPELVGVGSLVPLVEALVPVVGATSVVTADAVSVSVAELSLVVVPAGFVPHVTRAAEASSAR